MFLIFLALEVLIHQILEKESELDPDDESFPRLLPLVSRFLEEHYPAIFLDVIVRCARKSEESLWEFFFGVVGDAKDLFRVFLNIHFFIFIIFFQFFSAV